MAAPILGAEKAGNGRNNIAYRGGRGIVTGGYMRLGIAGAAGTGVAGAAPALPVTPMPGIMPGPIGLGLPPIAPGPHAAPGWQGPPGWPCIIPIPIAEPGAIRPGTMPRSPAAAAEGVPGIVAVGAAGSNGAAVPGTPAAGAGDVCAMPIAGVHSTKSEHASSFVGIMGILRNR